MFICSIECDKEKIEVEVLLALGENNAAFTFGDENMNIAYIILCHKDPNLLARVSKALEFEGDGLFVHVDKKTDITPFLNSCENRKNVVFVKERIDNYWGGYNAIVATFKTIELALTSGDFDRFVLLQGADYPLYHPSLIHSFFRKNRSKEFCKGSDISVSKKKNDYMKVAGFYLKDCSKNNIILYGISKLLNRINLLGVKYRSCCFKKNGKTLHIYHGWAQWSLTKDCIKFLYNYYKTNRKFNNYMKYRFPPDELYFQTVIENSIFKANLSDYVISKRNAPQVETSLNLTYFEYPKLVTVFRSPEELNGLKETGALFIRKVDSKDSVFLLDKIDKENMQGPVAEYEQ